MSELIEKITDLIHDRNINIEEVTEITGGYRFVKFKYEEADYLITILEIKQEKAIQ